MSYTKVYPTGFIAALYRDINGSSTLLEKDVYTFASSFTGDYNPYWKDLIRAGTNATTIASGNQISVDPGFTDNFVMLRSKSQPYTFLSSGLTGIPPLYGFDTNLVSAPASLVTSVTNRAIRKFLDSCDGARSSVELGQDLGEIRETIHGIIHPLQTLREFTFSHLSRVLKLSQTVKHKASLTKAVADTWLEYRFGWRPLALDIGQAYHDLVNNNHFNIQPVSGGAFDTFPISITKGVSTINGGYFNLRFNRAVTGGYSVSFKGGIRTGQSNGRIGFQQNMQLDLPHFVPTIWDLIPYTWIVDYFTNAGDIIRALCFQTQNLSWGKMTTRLTNSYSYDTDILYNFDFGSYDLIYSAPSSDNSSASIVSFHRTPVYPDDLVPRAQFTLPIGSLRPWENLTALFAGRQSEVSRVASHLR